jgi:hypothetical protein
MIKDMCDIRNELTERISSNGYTKDCYISQDDITAAISQLKFNKSDGGRGLYFKHGSNELAIHTANLFSGLITYGSVIYDFCTIVPIPKAKNANLIDSRAIEASHLAQYLVEFSI